MQASRTVCWVVCVLLAGEWSAPLHWRVEGQTTRAGAALAGLALPADSELSSRTPLAPEAARRNLTPDALLSRAEALARSVPRARYDLVVRADSLGAGVEPAFRFVRDQVRFEAYPGVLRGAAGAYATRAANAFDRSLLLAEILRRKGIRTRFALGRLPRAQADRLFARIFDPAPSLEPDAVAAFSLSPDSQALQAGLRARAVRDYAAIRKALGSALPSGLSPTRDEVVREIEEHVWVQAEVNGRWLDLDTTFSDAAPGRAYATPERTVDGLPAESYQQVTIRIVTETLAGGALATQTALEFTAAAEALSDRQIFLTHAPGAGKGGLAGALADPAAGPDAWTPVLWVDGTFHPGVSITFRDQPVPAARGGPPQGGLGSMFGAGGALSGGGSQLVAEWLEVEIVFPGGHRELARRALVDRAGVAGRQQGGAPDATRLRPLGKDADGPTDPRAVHNIWFSTGLHDVGAYAAALGLLAQWAKELEGPDAGSAGGAPSGEPSFGERMWPFAMMNFGFLIQSDHAVVPALNDAADHRLYPDSPRVLVVSVAPNPGTGSIDFRYDLRRDRLRGVVRDPSRAAALAERKVWFGVLQGALEHEMVARLAAAEGASASTVTSTSSLLTDEGVVVLRPSTSGSASVPSDRETAARLSEALARGMLVVLPRSTLRGGPAGWWEIAPAGAHTVAVLGNGLHGGEFKKPMRPPVGGIDVGPKGPLGDRLPRPTGPPSSPPGVIPGPDAPSRPPTQVNRKPPLRRPPLDKIGPGGKGNSKCQAAGNEYTAVSGCVSPAAAAVPAAAYAPILVYAALALGGVVAAVLGFVIASGL